MISSESTSAFGQPSDTNPTAGTCPGGADFFARRGDDVTAMRVTAPRSLLLVAGWLEGEGGEHRARLVVHVLLHLHEQVL